MDTDNMAQLDNNNKLYIEIGTKLKIEVEGNGAPIEGIFVGEKRGEYIVVTFPPNATSLGDEFFEGSIIDVKYLYQGQILAFQTKFMKAVYDPIHLFLLEYPKAVLEYDLRSQKRINCFISAKIEIETQKDTGSITGVIKDISKSGCLLLLQASKNTKDMFHINEQISLKCHFPGLAGDQEALGLVRDIRKKGDEMAVAVQFSEILWWVPPYGS